MVTSKSGQLESLFEGFAELKAISYVVSPQTLLDFKREFGFETIELIVGDSLSQSPYKSGLERQTELVEELVDLTESGVLAIWIPARTIHTKLYVLSNYDQHRIVQTSANLTETARKASRQINYAWYVDVSGDHPCP